MRTRTIDIGGIELAVLEHGEGGRPLVCAHGFTGSKEDFADWMEPLAEAGWHVVAADNRGHGGSDKPDAAEAYSIGVFAADTLALADTLGFDRFALIAHSMGGMFGQVVALKAPDRLTGLVLMDTHHGAVSSIDPDLIELGIAVALEQGMGVVADVIESMGGDGPLSTPANVRLLRERPERAVHTSHILRTVSPHMYAAMLREIPQQDDRLDQLATLAVPTLVVVGEQDEKFLEASRRLADTIPGAALAVIVDGGHSPQLESPEAWWTAVSPFLASLTD
jgi:pimeloyl-ACP methyl ester carboxylesterase